MPSPPAIAAGSNRFERVIFHGVAPAPRPALPRATPSCVVCSVIVPEHDPADLALVQLALKRCGLDPSAYRPGPLIRRVSACLRALRVDRVEKAAELIGTSGDKALTAINSLLIGTTGFFRDPQVFALLESLVIPRLLAARQHPRVWSAACSTGTELYSVAMLLAEQGTLAPQQLRGTDCREICIQSGAGGVFPGSSMDGVSHSRLLRHFTRGPAGSFEIRPEIRAATFWEREDLNDTDFPPEAYDLILCRNVAIYLDPAAVQQLWRRLAAALAPGGFLIVGKAEKISLPQFHRIAPCIYVVSE